jgi:hypothetical protein
VRGFRYVQVYCVEVFDFVVISIYVRRTACYFEIVKGFYLNLFSLVQVGQNQFIFLQIRHNSPNYRHLKGLLISEISLN